jgi:3-oxoacyl-[acyl-carrier protein] reductase
LRSPQNATVLITGAGRGIGKRFAIGFAHSGARVGLLGRSQGELDVTKLEIEHAGGTALRFRADVCNFDEMCAAVDRMTKAWGGVHTLIANAAVLGPVGPFVDQRPRDWQELIQTNVLGVLIPAAPYFPR